MNVGFYHAGRGDEQPARARIAILLQSVRTALSGVPVVHFTDLTTAPIKGVDVVLRRNVLPTATARVDAYASVSGEWLFIDSDVIVQADVRHIFEQSFDVALADRRGTERAVDAGTKCFTSMPYNSGVIFSRSQAFWQAALVRIAELSIKRQGWMGDQQAMCDVIASGVFDVKVLPSTYNYPPHRHNENVSDKAVLHFKGRERKAWMLDHAKAEVAA